MRQRLGMHHYSLTVQMVVSLVLLVLLTAVAAGVPAAWLLHSQVERQAWAQVDQGSHASLALYVDMRGKVADLALLTAQRPTLQTLLQADSTETLTDYLYTLRQGTDLTFILLCAEDGQPIAGSGRLPAQFCQQEEQSMLLLSGEGDAAELWLLGQEVVPGQVTKVVVGVQLDDGFARQMEAETGLHHVLLVNGRFLASSLPGGVQTWQNGELEARAEFVADAQETALLRSNGRSYYIAYIPLDNAQVVDAVTLDVSPIVAAQTQIVWTLASSIALVALVASVLGVWIARRIGQPLAHLTEAAVRIRAGDLDTPLSVPSKVQEVTLVTEAMEEARLGLQQTLTELRQAKMWADHLLEAIVEGIVTLDRHGRITFFSAGAARITGLASTEALHHSCDQVFHPADTDQPFSQFIPPPGKQRKVTLALADNRHITVSVTGARLTPPDVADAGVALVFRDISESDLMHRILGQFLANVTHEFRTPLSAVAASTELLLDQAPDLSPQELHQLLNSLHLGIVGLQTLVDNLLESASMEIGRFRVHVRTCDLGEMIGEATHMMQPLLDKYGQWLTVELPMPVPLVQADPRRVMQVLVNLLSNAIKYSPDETEIKISATMQDTQVCIALADQGPGVPSGFRPNLFHRFPQPDAAGDKSQYGAGLGLFVAKAITEAHGGQMDVAERPGGGSVFWFTLPLAN
ncbi:MAG: HAMP domain-containing protein [Ardenticatenaceae bacterium]|nr:HAMP domain-containing protein [Ardenticatenaceae bacterium]